VVYKKPKRAVRFKEFDFYKIIIFHQKMIKKIATFFSITTPFDTLTYKMSTVPSEFIRPFFRHFFDQNFAQKNTKMKMENQEALMKEN